ncbi:MAG TPA: hypothetical protein VGS07_02070 [Thermoanaerobaculia bacterium]|jgi:hypothetical protein|nr:hypothetical protein [Thermoanaerobaculia bacterium]
MTTIAKLLEIQFQGYFMCRIATDPDPTNEQRGVSGYTMALVGEDPLDQVIRTQIEDPEFLERNLRPPAREMGIRVGVDVNDVLFDGQPYFGPARDALVGARLYLEGTNPPFPGPTYDSRNNIVGSDDNMAFVVNPFQLALRQGPAGDESLLITAEDYLNPVKPEQKIWEIEDPETYARRLPVTFSSSSTPAQAAIRAFDGAVYFQDRVKYLRKLIAELELRRAEASDPEVITDLDTGLAELNTRIWQIDFWASRIETKLAFQLTYSFNVNGPQRVVDRTGSLQGEIDCGQPWPVSFWFGSWDGDLLIGWMQGSLSVPFRPAG